MMRYYGGYGMGGFGLLGGLLWVLFVVVVVLLIVMLIRRAGGMHGHGPMMHDHMHGTMGEMTPGTPAGPVADEAVAVARKRLAAGEITHEQFDELMAKLKS